ncbi:hypothetical protein niasHT_006690 [Heterodera trifolii]|uniref:Uncharacterized protein n=1 Tax=Heterodera trifolii TaxID=157864 RepID=A0ABD2MB81_9BILA
MIAFWNSSCSTFGHCSKTKFAGCFCGQGILTVCDVSAIRPFSAIVHLFTLSFPMTTFSLNFRPDASDVQAIRTVCLRHFSTASSRANFVIVICNWSNYDFVVPFDLTIYVEKWPNNNKHFLLIRFPFREMRNQWTKWKKEAIKLELVGQMEHNSTLELMRIFSMALPTQVISVNELL